MHQRRSLVMRKVHLYKYNIELHLLFWRYALIDRILIIERGAETHCNEPDRPNQQRVEITSLEDNKKPLSVNVPKKPFRLSGRMQEKYTHRVAGGSCNNIGREVMWGDCVLETTFTYAVRPRQGRPAYSGNTRRRRLCSLDKHVPKIG